ncbi:hypothetical protein [Phycicoccus flavus]|uniref:hypothetical protein n=1 Tax=Phycicoccus flavus TaxID=2502783 RepID=UPI000FEBD0E5|nr:hypothetical protein [Phycicoccus flavus]NHA67007.1 hypothetical protein [Phycicoccus flavus]
MRLFDRWRASAGTTTPSSSTPRRTVAEVHDTDDAALDDVVRAHLERLTAAAENSPDTLGPREFEAALTSRLVAQRDLPPGDRRYQYVTPFAPHVAEVLTLDLPMAVVTLPQERVAVGQRSFSALVSIGRQNLERTLRTAEVEVRAVGDRRSACRTVVGDSPYTGSFARFLSEAAARFLPGADTGNGVVFAVPDRHALVLSPCTTAPVTAAALEHVPAQARLLFDTGSGPVSPHVYHWYHRRLTCLTTEEPDGSLSLTTTPVLDTVLGATRRPGARVG